ncbi:hypothetical protein Btru_031580 [Bulinus truncatus]|nr:hypothetical protein Btru_031580 [Bulinus truncatus]
MGDKKRTQDAQPEGTIEVQAAHYVHIRRNGKFTPNGCVCVCTTLGGNDLKVPAEIVDKMVSAFQELDLGVVWRMNTSSTAPRNIMAAAWVPQNDLLGHPNTKVFISHCGKNGQYEALYHGVPILCLPMYGDQWYNARRGSAKGFGLYADIREVTAGELAGLIRQVAYDPKYRSNIQRASKLFRELQSPQQGGRLLAASRDEIWRGLHEVIGSGDATVPVSHAGRDCFHFGCCGRGCPVDLRHHKTMPRVCE